MCLHVSATLLQAHAELQAAMISLGLTGWDHVVTMWLIFAACGVLQLVLSYAICSPLERYLPLVRWPTYTVPVTDVVYAFVNRIVLFPLFAYFEYDFLQSGVTRFMTTHGLPALSLPNLLGSSVLAFILGFVVLDLTDYGRHRLAHRFGWFYGVHSLHHAEDHMTFWSDDRNHLLEDAITYVMLMAVGLAIGIPSVQFPFVILGFRLIGSVAHANTRVRYGFLGERLIISPQFHRTHHALKSTGRGSFNLGTSFPWWDMAFGTADFATRTVETGDAGAEPALVSGSWGAQQLAGLRRMWQLGRVRKPKSVNPAKLISQTDDDWRRRVLGATPTPLASWQEAAYNKYRELLMAEDYPCFFGQAAERTGQMFYAFVDQGSPSALAAAMRQFVRLLAVPAHARFSLVAFFQVDPALHLHADFVSCFWHALRDLNIVDPHPSTNRCTEDPLWEFSFDGCEMFVVGLSPTYQQRRSRNVGPGMALVFQPRILFTDPATGQPISMKVRHALHERMLAYDALDVHPDIGIYGDPQNQEWKQYALPDNNAPATGSCPITFTSPSS